LTELEKNKGKWVGEVGEKKARTEEKEVVVVGRKPKNGTGKKCNEGRKTIRYGKQGRKIVGIQWLCLGGKRKKKNNIERKIPKTGNHQTTEESPGRYGCSKQKSKD